MLHVCEYLHSKCDDRQLPLSLLPLKQMYEDESFMGTMRMMLETICEKQTVALRMVLDEAYKLLDKEKSRKNGNATATETVISTTTTTSQSEEPEL